jgi:threonine synthase
MPFAAITKLAAAGELQSHERVVTLITSSGLKDPESMYEAGDVPLAEPTLSSLVAVLGLEYGFGK